MFSNYICPCLQTFICVGLSSEPPWNLNWNGDAFIVFCMWFIRLSSFLSKLFVLLLIYWLHYFHLLPNQFAYQTWSFSYDLLLVSIHIFLLLYSEYWQRVIFFTPVMRQLHLVIIWLCRYRKEWFGYPFSRSRRVLYYCFIHIIQ